MNNIAEYSEQSKAVSLGHEQRMLLIRNALRVQRLLLNDLEM
jgi:ABC-type transport system involved in cytochrome bd biosynthesis fused ATPase/permease subunit